jgi:hypothetical protein
VAGFSTQTIKRGFSDHGGMNEGDANSPLQIYKNLSNRMSDWGITLVKIASYPRVVFVQYEIGLMG